MNELKLRSSACTTFIYSFIWTKRRSKVEAMNHLRVSNFVEKVLELILKQRLEAGLMLSGPATNIRMYNTLRRYGRRGKRGNIHRRSQRTRRLIISNIQHYFDEQQHQWDLRWVHLRRVQQTFHQERTSPVEAQHWRWRLHTQRRLDIWTSPSFNDRKKKEETCAEESPIGTRKGMIEYSNFKTKSRIWMLWLK